MKLSNSIRLTLVAAALACTARADAQQVPTATPTAPPALTAESIDNRAAQMPVIGELRIHQGPLAGAVEQLSSEMRVKKLPPMNVVYSPDARAIAVPDMVLQNVNGPDALRLIAVSAGCDLEDISGGDGQTIGYRVYSANRGGYSNFSAAYGRGVAPAALPDPAVAPSAEETSPQIPGFPGAPGGAFPPPTPIRPIEALPGPGMAPSAAHIDFVSMPAGNANSVRVYSLGSITNTTKFADVEKTLREILQVGGISSEAAKLGFHEKTNVLVVTAEPRVHELVTQYLDALQKNVAEAAMQNKRDGVDRRELVEAMLRLEAEKEQRMRVMKQFEEAEERLRESQRELDRLRAIVPKPQ